MLYLQCYEQCLENKEESGTSFTSTFTPQFQSDVTLFAKITHKKNQL
jgi:hypothetical protein